MSKKYVGVETLQALMEILKTELDATTTDVTNTLDLVIKKEDIINDISSYIPPAEGQDPDNKVVSAAIIKELQEAVNELMGITKEPDPENPGEPPVEVNKDNVAIKFGDMIKTWEDYNVDTDADKVIAASLIKAMKDQIDALSTTIADELEGKKGQPGGIASLDENGKVPSEQLPSYVDDCIEGFLVETTSGEGETTTTTRTFYEADENGNTPSSTEIVGEKGKIYVDLATNFTYRWSGTTYIRINEINLTEITAEEVENIWNEVYNEFNNKENVDV